jgi:CHASE3 domain sensor protein
MCANGVNTQQLKDTVTQIDETIALTRRWTHRMYHLADGGQMERAAQKLQAVQGMLDEVRSILDETQDAIDKDDADNGVTVTAV